MTSPPGRPAPTVSDVMITEPKTLPVGSTIRSVHAAFDDEHVHMVLLTESGILRGTLSREDIPALAAPGGRALAWATLAGRTVGPAEAARVVHRRLVESGRRRLAVVDTDLRLLGLLCLKRDRRGFCTIADIRSRAAARAAMPVLAGAGRSTTGAG